MNTQPLFYQDQEKETVLLGMVNEMFLQLPGALNIER
jgi:hypothetical protein